MRHPVGGKRHGHTGIEQLAQRRAARAQRLQVEAVARHVHEVGRHRRHQSERLDAADLLRRGLGDMHRHPAPPADRHLPIDLLEGAQHPFKFVAHQGADADAQPCRRQAQRHQPLVRQGLIEVPGPLLIRIAGGDDARGIGIGHIQAQAFLAQQAGGADGAAGSCQARRPMRQHCADLAVAEGRARHRKRQLHAQGQFARRLQPAIGIDHLRGDAMTFEGGGDAGSAGHTRGVAQPGVAVFVGETRHAGEQRVLEHRRPVALQEEAGRFTRPVPDNFHLGRRHGLPRNARKRQRPGVGHRRQRLAAPPTPGRAYVHRMVGRGAVEVMTVGKAPLAQLAGLEHVVFGRRAHRQGDDPLARRRVGRRCAHRSANLRHRAALRDRHAAQVAQTDTVQVRVGIVETRHHRAPGQVDHARTRVARGAQRGTVADGRDQAVLHGQRASRAVDRFERVDPAAVQDEVGCAHRGRSTAGDLTRPRLRASRCTCSRGTPPRAPARISARRRWRIRECTRSSRHGWGGGKTRSTCGSPRARGRAAD